MPQRGRNSCCENFMSNLVTQPPLFTGYTPLASAVLQKQLYCDTYGEGWIATRTKGTCITIYRLSSFTKSAPL